MNRRNWKLIVGHNFSLSNETDSDIMTDYNPGIWAIKTQKRALEHAKRILAEGDSIKVDDYDNASYHKLANMFIRELGLSQPLFKEPEALKSSDTGNKPSNLSQLKKYLSVGKKIHIDNYGKNERDTVILETHTNDIVVEKIAGTGTKSWLELGKASEWVFTNKTASKYYIDRDGKQVASTTITYLE